jgi:alanine racemase
MVAPFEGPNVDQRLGAAGLPPLPRGAWLEIDLDALAGNLRVVRELVGPRTETWAVVKADAYGHGIEMAARTFAAAGAQRLCVATLDEALLLRRAGITAPLLVMFPIPISGLHDAVAAGLDLAASDAAGARELLARWRAARGRAGDADLRLHLEIETGLGRGGVLPDAATDLAAAIGSAPGAVLAGLWTHLAAPEDELATAAQVEAFEGAAESLRRAGVAVPARHASSSGGIFAGRDVLYDAVRPGLALYGLLADDLPISDACRDAAQRLRPAMMLKCRPVRVETLPAGSGVSYGGAWRAESEARVATLPLGYGDGFSRAYWPGGEALVRGRRVPLVGTVAMDAVMADVSSVPGVGLEDEFVLLGAQGAESIAAGEMARRRNTIAWEVVTSMSQRLPRVYHAGAVPMALRTILGEMQAEPR